ncbi:hypothetical protein ACVWXM_001433 [Bradyrhizobium sp. GM7.3]
MSKQSIPTYQNQLHRAAIFWVGFASLTAGYLASRLNPGTMRRTGLSNLFSRIEFLQLTAKPIFAIGLLLQGLHIILRPEFVPGANVAQEGFGGFGAFYFLLPFSIAMQTALCIFQPSRKANAFTLVVMLLLVAAESVLGNVKKNIVDAALIVACSYFLFDKANVNIKAVIASIAALGILILYINPLIHIMRPSLYGLSFEQRIDLGVRTLEDTHLDPWELADRSARVLRGYEAQFSPTGSYFYPSTLNFDRFALILPLDQVVRALPRAGTMGAQIFSTIVSTVLPSFVVPKEAAATPDLIAWHFGFRTIGSVSRPVVGLIPSAVAGFGILGAALIPFVIIFLGFRILNLIAGSFEKQSMGHLDIFLFHTSSRKGSCSVHRILPKRFRSFHVVCAHCQGGVHGARSTLFSESSSANENLSEQTA